MKAVFYGLLFFIALIAGLIVLIYSLVSLLFIPLIGLYLIERIITWYFFAPVEVMQ